MEGRTEIELIYVLTPSAWRKGYATEVGRALARHALETMGLTPSDVLAEPCGMCM